MVDLSGKVALVTGASRGIGHDLAIGLARAGAAVLLNFNSHREGGEDAIAQIQTAGGRALIHEGDISSVQVCRELVTRCVHEFGRLDIACCHAGITSWGKFFEYSEAEFDAAVDVNLKGSYFTAQAAARQMRDQGTGGRIIVTSSVVGNQAIPYLSAYAMTKGGLQMLVRNLVMELSPHHITINALGVGPIVNERNLEDDREYAEKWSRVVPLGRAGRTWDVVNAALFLASDQAEWITGHTLMIDGGWTALSPTPDFEFVERKGQVERG